MVSASRTASYSLASLFLNLEVPYALRGATAALRTVRYALSEAVRRDVTGAYALLTTTPVNASRNAVFALFCPVAEINDSISASVNGKELRVTELDMSCDEDSYCISCTLELAGATEWSRCSPGQQLVVLLGGTSFAFQVDSRSRDRTFGKTSYTAYARSAAMLLDEPYAAPLTSTWTDTTARGIAQELCDAYGVSLDWRLVDWPLASYSAESLTPMEILAELMTESGVLLSSSDGVLVAQYLYPVSPTRYEACDPELELSDLEDILTLKDSYESAPGYNAVSVLIDQDQDETEVELLVWDGDEDGVEASNSETQRIVALFPSRLSGLQSSNSDVVIFDQGVRTFEKEETVALVSGEGECSYPPDQLLEYAYRSCDLGALTVTGKAVCAAEAGHSAIYLRYLTSYHCYLVQCDSGTQGLVYLEAELEDEATQLVHVNRAPADNPAPEIQEDSMCTNELSARERGRIYLDVNGFDKEWYEAETPLRTLPLPGAVISVLDGSRGLNFRAKLVGWSVNASLVNGVLCSRVTYDLERSLV